MPPRTAVAGIIAFWLATTAYVVYRDIWPRVFATGPPPVSIELADEARQNVPAKWLILHNGKQAGKLTTQMRYLDAEDRFVFTYRYPELRFDQGEMAFVFTDVIAEMQITRDGDLRGQTLSGKVSLVSRTKGSGGKDAELMQGTLDVRGAVANGTLTGRAEFRSTLLNLSGDLEPTPVPAGQPLNPLQPVNRLRGVRGGLTWVVHRSNPLQDALGQLLRKSAAQYGFRLKDPEPEQSLVAEVGGAPQDLMWQNQVIPCWVIEYRRDEVVARTWVRVSDGKVLRQEAFEKGEALVFERED